MTQLTLDITKNETDIHEKNEDFLIKKIGDITYKRAKLIDVEKQYLLQNNSRTDFDEETITVKYQLSFLEDNQIKKYITSFAPNKINEYYFYTVSKNEKISIFSNNENTNTRVRQHIIERTEKKYNLDFPFFALLTTFFAGLVTIPIDVKIGIILPIIGLLITVSELTITNMKNKKKNKKIFKAYF